MPELRSGLTQVFKAHQDKKKVRLGPKLEEFIRLAVPDVNHVLALAHLVSAGRDGCPAREIAAATGAPKGAVKAALERFGKLKLAEPRGGVMTRRYAFAREGGLSELAVRLVKLWAHPRTHETVTRKILSKSQAGGGPGAKAQP